MHTVQALHPTHHATSSIPTTGPLPKSDSVQSLVSLINSPNPTTSQDLQQCAVRGVDTNACPHSVQITEETDHVALSGLSLETLNLDALASGVSHRLRELSLAANSLHVIDLTPLASCPALTVLTLNSNRLVSIDLRPLASCPKLERLWLHDNCLETIDLQPLANCKMLRSLYLEDNSLHNHTIDLSPMVHTQNMRSLRLGGNRLGAKLDLTPLFQCPALSVFNIDSCVSLIADGESSQARVSSALRRVVLDIKFTGKPVEEPPPTHRRPTPQVSPKNGLPSLRTRRRVSPPGSPPGGIARRKPVQKSSSSCVTRAAPPTAPIIKVLLVGFRRLARYAAEDRLSQCGKVIIRAADTEVASRDPSQLLDSHLVLLYSPPEKTLRQVTVVVGRIPTVVVGSERYRSTADNRKLELLDGFNFYVDPMSADETKSIYDMATTYATGSCSQQPTSAGQKASGVGSYGQSGSPPNEQHCTSSTSNLKPAMRKSCSASTLSTTPGEVHIELEHIEDEEDSDSASSSSEPGSSSGFFSQRRSVDGLPKVTPAQNVPSGPATTWSEVTRKLAARRGHKVGRGWGSYLAGELSAHGKNKLRAERAAIEVAFSDLGGYATAENCTAIAKACGLPKCAGSVLFKAAFGSSFDIESTTPEAGVPNLPLERKHRRISVDSFMGYWDSRLKAFNGEERLSNVLKDGHLTRSRATGMNTGHSQYGAPCLRKARSSVLPYETVPNLDVAGFVSTLRQADGDKEGLKCFRRAITSPNLSADLTCPCDAGIEALITSFMEGRSSRFGSFALVKMSEAIAIGSALVMYGLRGMSMNRVGGRARPVCPKEIRDGKLNAALIAAEVGIFEGVTSGLSMDQIRHVKSCFVTEASPGAIPRNGGVALDCTLSVDEVTRFCMTRKSLMPGAVEHLMKVHCKDHSQMTLSEFSVLLSVLNNVSSNGAVDYLFTVADVDQDDRWTLPDLRQFHMEKERLWFNDDMAVSELSSLWVNLLDMIRPAKPARGLSRKEVLRLGCKERRVVLQSLLFLDDDHSLLNIRRTMEMNKQSASAVVVM